MLNVQSINAGFFCVQVCTVKNATKGNATAERPHLAY